MTSGNFVTMRLTGHQAPFTLAPAAHRELMDYLADARAELADNPDGDEIVRDVEVSIGDHLGGRGESPVDQDRMREILDQVGPVVSEPASIEPTGNRYPAPTWCRILEGKWLTGVCLGISAATRSSVAWVRAIYVAVTLVGGALLAPFSDYVMLVFFGLSVLLYLAMSLLLPPVSSIAEYRRRSPGRDAAPR